MKLLCFASVLLAVAVNGVTVRDAAFENDVLDGLDLELAEA